MKLQIVTTDGENMTIPIEKIESIGIIDMSSISEDIVNAVVSAMPMDDVIESIEEKTKVGVIDMDDTKAEVVETVVESPTEIMSEDFIAPKSVDIKFHDSEGKEYVVVSDPIVEEEEPPIIEEVANPKKVEQKIEKDIEKACDDIVGEILFTKPMKPITVTKEVDSAPIIRNIGVNNVTPRKVVQINPTMTEI